MALNHNRNHPNNNNFRPVQVERIPLEEEEDSQHLLVQPSPLDSPTHPSVMRKVSHGASLSNMRQKRSSSSSCDGANDLSNWNHWGALRMAESVDPAQQQQVPAQAQVQDVGSIRSRAMEHSRRIAAAAQYREAAAAPLAVAGPPPPQPLQVFPAKRAKAKDAVQLGGVLHATCQQFPHSFYIIQAALSQDPQAAARPLVIPAVPTRRTGTPFVVIPTLQKQRREPFRIPINIALHHGASSEVLDLLLRAAPAATLVGDGAAGDTCTLLLALTKRPRDDDLFLTKLLALQPAAAWRTDRRLNTALHLAANAKTHKHSAKLSVTFISYLYRANPQAVGMRNMHNETPYVISQRNSSCPEEVVTFLRTVSSEEQV